MDKKLEERLRKIAIQIESVYHIESSFLSLDAARENLLAVLTRDAPEECSSEASRATWAKATDRWREFKKGLAEAESLFHREKHLLDLKFKAFDAESKSYSIEHEAIRRGVE